MGSSISAKPSAGPSGVSRGKAVFAVSVGNALEWFDWTVYATFSTYFASQFFHSPDGVSDLLKTLAVFAAGFVVRPIGGLLFGAIADRRGRRFVMVMTMSLVALSSILVAVAPTYDTVGVFASTWLVVVRCLQGLAHGGELGGAYTYVAEIAPRRRRGLWGSAIIVSTVAGTTLATLLNALMQLWLDQAAMTEWGWRVPFFVGGLIALFALYLRRRIAESGVFAESTTNTSAGGTRSKGDVLRGLWESRAMVARVVVLVGSTSVFSYTWSTNAPTYAINFFGVRDSGAMWAGVGANVIFMAALPLSAILADRVGRRFNFIVWGGVFTALSFPIFLLLDDTATRLFLVMSLALILQSLAASTQVAWFGELFSTVGRATAVGFAVSLASAIFGGTAPYLNSWLTSLGVPEAFNWYLVVLALCATVTAYFTPETTGMNLGMAGRASTSSNGTENAAETQLQ